MPRMWDNAARYSRPIIGEIDRVLPKHHGFTNEDMNFIVGGGIKYRMGGADDGKED